MAEHVPNELNVKFLSTIGLNPFMGHDSSPRIQMFSSHITQSLVVAGATEHRIQTGMEQEFGKYTLSIRMPEDGVILRVIDRYPKTLAVDNIRFNPETLVIYESEETKKIGCFSIPYYASYHQYFGFKYKFTENLNRLVPGSRIQKDTIFADSPNITENGGYKYGIELNAAFMSLPSTSEDGIMVSRDVLPKLAFKVYETRVVEFGNGSFPLNLYGDEKIYKPFPDIGECIRGDGILCATRQHSPLLSPVDMSIHDTREIDYIFDACTYVRGGGGRIVDIKVHHDETLTSTTPIGMETFITKYTVASRSFYTQLLAVESELRSQRKKKYGTTTLPLLPEFHRLLVEARSMTDSGGVKSAERLNHLFRKAPIDDYRIEFTIEYEIIPDIGFKKTGLNGTFQVRCLEKASCHVPL